VEHLVTLVCLGEALARPVEEVRQVAWDLRVGEGKVALPCQAEVEREELVLTSYQVEEGMEAC